MKRRSAPSDLNLWLFVRARRGPAICGLLLVGLTAHADASALVRRPISPPSRSGWVRVPLDEAAQRLSDTLWIGDATGRSVPFLREHEQTIAAQPLVPRDLVIGPDPSGRPTFEFSIAERPLEGAALKIDVELAATSEFVLRVEASRRASTPEGPFLAVEFARPVHLYGLGGDRHATFELPWDAAHYRVHLSPVYGDTPRVVGVTLGATAARAPAESRSVPARLEPQGTDDPGPRVALDAPLRVVGFDITLAPPAAPLGVTCFHAHPSPGPREKPWIENGAGALWNLPALGSLRTRIPLSTPIVAQTFALAVADGAPIERVEAIVEEEVLTFAAEAGTRYHLHLGAARKPAAGTLEGLPSADRVAAHERLFLGPAQSDPDAVAPIVSWEDRLKAFFPGLIAAIVLGLAVVAWRLLRGPRHDAR